MSVAEMGWDEAQRYWAERFAHNGFDGVRLLASVYYLQQRHPGDVIRLSEKNVAPSKLAWLIQNGFAEAVADAEQENA